MLVRDLASPFRFAEHDVFIPMVALEEPDAKKSPPGVCCPQQGLYSDRGGDVEALVKALGAGHGLPQSRPGRTCAQPRTEFRAEPAAGRGTNEDPAGPRQQQAGDPGQYRPDRHPPASKTASGLSCAVDRFKHWQHGGHITLQSGERSRPADFAGIMRRLLLLESLIESEIPCGTGMCRQNQ